MGTGLKKKISIVLPCYNEQDNIEPIANELIGLFNNKLAQYEYELLFIDNNSSDATRDKIRALAKDNKNIKAIFNYSSLEFFHHLLL